MPAKTVTFLKPACDDSDFGIKLTNRKKIIFSTKRILILSKYNQI